MGDPVGFMEMLAVLISGTQWSKQQLNWDTPMEKNGIEKSKKCTPLLFYEQSYTKRV